MAALLASVCSVPLTSVLLLFELTKDYHILLPLMVKHLYCICRINLVASCDGKDRFLSQRYVLRYLCKFLGIIIKPMNVSSLSLLCGFTPCDLVCCGDNMSLFHVGGKTIVNALQLPCSLCYAH